MSENAHRSISIHLEGEDQALWAVYDDAVPSVGDEVVIEQADGSTRYYEVVGRTWFTAKQGEHSFTRVRVTVKAPTWREAIRRDPSFIRR